MAAKQNWSRDLTLLGVQPPERAQYPPDTRRMLSEWRSTHVPTRQQICPSPKCWAKLEKLMWLKSKPAIYALNLLLGNPEVPSAPLQECQVLPCWHNNTKPVPEG